MALRDWGWFVIIQKTRPLVGRPDPNEELKLLEENKVIEDEKKALIKQIESEQGNLGVYHERQAQISSEKAELEVALAGATDKLAKTKQARADATNDKKALEQETTAIKKDIGDLEVVIQKLGQEKGARDHTIRSLNDEIANQDEIINKLNKEKKHISEIANQDEIINKLNK